MDIIKRGLTSILATVMLGTQIFSLLPAYADEIQETGIVETISESESQAEDMETSNTTEQTINSGETEDTSVSETIETEASQGVYLGAPSVVVPLNMSMDQVRMQLPTTISWTDGTEVVSVPVSTWTCDNYDGTTKGVYTFVPQVSSSAYVAQLPKSLVMVADTCTCLSQDEDGHPVHDQDNSECVLYSKDTATIGLDDGTQFIVNSDDADIYIEAGGQLVSHQTLMDIMPIDDTSLGARMNASMKAHIDSIASMNPTDGYSTESTTDLGLEYSWYQYINRIWENKAMGVGWTDLAALGNTIPQWSGIVASEENTLLSGIPKTTLGDLMAATGTTWADPKKERDRKIAEHLKGIDPAGQTGNEDVVPFSTNELETVQNVNYLKNMTLSPTTTMYTRTFYVWTGEQLIYALKFGTLPTTTENTSNATLNAANPNPDRSTGEPNENKPADNPLGNATQYGKIKIVLMQDIDLDGNKQNWPIVSMYKMNWARVELDGNNHTVYNLGIYRDDSYTNATVGRGVGLFIGYSGLNVYDITFESAKMVAATDQNASVGIFGRVEGMTSGSNSAIARAYGYGKSSIDNVVIRNSVFFSTRKSSWVSALGVFSTNSNVTPAVDVKNCSVTSCYLYGGDHVAGLSVGLSGNSGILEKNGTQRYDESTVCNSYVTDTLVATFGGHSGGFLSCETLEVDVQNCFSSVDMYAAGYSGGFVGLFYGNIENCFSTGKIEGFKYCAGFVASVQNSGVHGYGKPLATITSCYSTMLVGIRQETQFSGGFYATSPSTLRGSYTTAYMMTDCYAAGEVGDTGLDVSKSSTTTKDNGGFVSTIKPNTNDANNQNQADHCYYDKQTTAMREWVSGAYNAQNDSSTATYDIEKTVTGTLTTGHEVTLNDGTKAWSIGLTEDPNNPKSGYTTYVGFKGFYDNSKWHFEDGFYPQLKCFQSATTADGWTAEQLPFVHSYSYVSAATVFLETWAQGYVWDDDGVRSGPIDYTSLIAESHKADVWTYDTVREMVVDCTYSTTATAASGLSRISAVQQLSSETLKQEMDPAVAGAVIGTDIFAVTQDVSHIQVVNPGMGWFRFDDSVTGTKVVGSRPLRLIASLGIDAGNDEEVYAGVNYDHREGVLLSVSRSVEPNMVLGLDDQSDASGNMPTWSRSYTSGYAREKDGAGNISPDTTTKYYKAVTNNLDADPDLDKGDAVFVNDAWLYTEIRRVEQYYPSATDPAMPAVSPSKYNVPLPATYNDATRYYWSAESDSDGNWGVYLKQYASTTQIVNNDLDIYVEAESVNINGPGSNPLGNFSLDEQKWNGIIALYPDSSAAKKYVVTYFWILEDGRYRSDSKTVSIKPGHYNMYMNAYTYNQNNTEDISTPNGQTLYLQPNKDVLYRNVDADGNTSYVYKRVTSNVLSEGTRDSAIIGPTAASTDLSTRGETKDPPAGFDFTTDVTDSLTYTQDASAVWLPVSDTVSIQQIRMTMYARNGDIMGQSIAPLITEATYNANTAAYANQSYIYQDSNGIWNGQIAVTSTYYTVVLEDVKDSSGSILYQREVTKNEELTMIYKLYPEYDTSGGLVAYYFAFCKFANGNFDGFALTQHPDFERATNDHNRDGLPLKPNGDIDVQGYINDSQYNVRLDFFVSYYGLTIKKDVLGNYGKFESEYTFDVNFANIDRSHVDSDGLAYSIYEKGATTPKETGNITVIAGGTASKTGITLSHGDYIVITKIPKDTTYTIVENDTTATVTTVKWNDDGTDLYKDPIEYSGNAPPGTYTGIAPVNYNKDSKTVYSKFTGEEKTINQFIVYGNSNSIVPPTGENLTNYRVYILLLSVAAVAAMCMGLGFYQYKKLRKQRLGVNQMQKRGIGGVHGKINGRDCGPST